MENLSVVWQPRLLRAGRNNVAAALAGVTGKGVQLKGWNVLSANASTRRLSRGALCAGRQAVRASSTIGHWHDAHTKTCYVWHELVGNTQTCSRLMAWKKQVDLSLLSSSTN